MSQDELDRLFEFLRTHPEEMERMRNLGCARFVKQARRMGYLIDEDELLARQALIHMIEGT